MDTHELTVALNQLGYSTIQRLVYDLLDASVTVRILSEREENNPQEHNVRFEEVVSLFHTTGMREDRFRLNEPTDEGGWNDGAYYENGVARIAPASIADTWAEQFYGIPNFAIELAGQGSLMIEARGVIIDGRSFEVGYADPKGKPKHRRPTRDRHSEGTE